MSIGMNLLNCHFEHMYSRVLTGAMSDFRGNYYCDYQVLKEMVRLFVIGSNIQSFFKKSSLLSDQTRCNDFRHRYDLSLCLTMK